jgi:protein-disulfide isomerase
MKIQPSRAAFALAAFALPLTLGLAACKKADDTAATGTATSGGAAVANVPPPAGKAWSDVVAATAGGGMLMGNPAAPIKLLEYGSLSCPHCAKFAADGFHPLVDKYINTGRVSYEYRSFAIHSIDVPLTVLVRCADPSAFFGLVEQLYVNQPALMDKVMKNEAAANSATRLPPAQRFVALSDTLGFTEFFAARGVSTDQAHSCLAQPASTEKIAKEAQTFSDAGIDSTPTLLINGTKTEVNTWAEIEPLLQRYGAR